MWGEERVEVERYAACACAEIEDAEGAWRARGGGREEEEGGEVGGYVLCFCSAKSRYSQSVSQSVRPLECVLSEHGR